MVPSDEKRNNYYANFLHFAQSVLSRVYKKGEESILLCIGVCKHPLKSTKVKLTTTTRLVLTQLLSNCIQVCDHSNPLAMLDYMCGYSSGYQASRLQVDKCIPCVVLHKLTSVLFKGCLHTPVQSRTLSFPLLIYSC